MTESTDCRQCGACCFSMTDRYVVVTGDDWSRLGSTVEKVAHFIGTRAYMQMTGGHCAALEVRVAADGTADYFCRVYESRPQVCRDLERGSPQCSAERVTKAKLTSAAARRRSIDLL